MPRVAATVLALAGLLACRGIAAAQEFGTVAGVVKEQSGAVLPGVTVRVVSVGLIERVRTTLTDGSGRYRVVNLPVGVYTVAFSLAGYSPAVRVGVEVSAGVTAAVDAELSGGPLDSPSAGTGPRRLGRVSSGVVMRPYVRCGLTIVPGDPKVDAKMRVPFDQAPGGPSVRSRTEHSMRTRVPQICGEK
jgi:Carboxypeptidase regulatory-like domain